MQYAGFLSLIQQKRKIASHNPAWRREQRKSHQNEICLVKERTSHPRVYQLKEINPFWSLSQEHVSELPIVPEKPATYSDQFKERKQRHTHKAAREANLSNWNWVRACDKQIYNAFAYAFFVLLDIVGKALQQVS